MRIDFKFLKSFYSYKYLLLRLEFERCVIYIGIKKKFPYLSGEIIRFY